MIHTSWPSTFTPTSLVAHFKKNRTSLMLLVFLLVTSLQTDAGPAKKVLTGEDVKAYETWLKTKDGTEYGMGLTESDIKWLFRLLGAQFLVWIGMFGFKAVDWWKGDKDNDKKKAAESRDAWLKAQHDIAYIKEHMVTESEVKKLVRDEILYLRESRGKV